MSETRITVNGKHYKSPEEMPPDVRRQYEQAMRMIGPALASAQGSATTRVDTTSRTHGAQGDIVIQKTITVNQRTYPNADEMPPELRQYVATGLQATGTDGAPTAPGLNLAVELGRPKVRTFLNVHPSPSSPLPIEPSNMPSEARRFVYDIAFWVIVGLALWFWLGRY